MGKSCDPGLMRVCAYITHVWAGQNESGGLSILNAITRTNNIMRKKGSWLYFGCSIYKHRFSLINEAIQ